MTPTEKALELLDKFRGLAHSDWHSQTGYDLAQGYENAKQCATIVADIHLDELSKMKLIFSDREIHYKFWKDVKTELEKL